jgi:hypothetical protein
LARLDPAPEDGLVRAGQITHVAQQAVEHLEIERRLARLEDFLHVTPERLGVGRRELRRRRRRQMRIQPRDDGAQSSAAARASRGQPMHHRICGSASDQR